jgi:hypothetical protein
MHALIVHTIRLVPGAAARSSGCWSRRRHEQVDKRDSR